MLYGKPTGSDEWSRWVEREGQENPYGQRDLMMMMKKKNGESKEQF